MLIKLYANKKRLIEFLEEKTLTMECTSTPIIFESDSRYDYSHSTFDTEFVIDENNYTISSDSKNIVTIQKRKKVI